MDIRKSFNEGRIGPSPLSLEISKTFFAPLVDACDLQKPESVAKLKAGLSRIPVFAYSYGTSLLQQVAAVMVADLSEKYGADETKGIKIYDICRSVKAVNIGPVGRYQTIESDGTLNHLNYDDPYFEDAQTIFSQLSFLMRRDTIVQRSLGDESLGGLTESDVGVEVRSTATATHLIDYVGEPVRRVLGFVEILDGETVPKIKITPDRYIHDFKTYTNIFERQGDFVVFPSLAITPVLRTATVSMLTPQLDGRNWIEKMRRLATPLEQREAMVANLQTSLAELDNLLRGFEDTPDTERGAYLKEYISCIPEQMFERKPLSPSTLSPQY